MLTIATAASGAHAATVDGNVASWLTQARMVGAAPSTETVQIVVHLALKDRTGLEALVKAVSTPGSLRYGQYLSASAFAARFAPGPADVAAVTAMLKGAGMTGIAAGPHGTYVAATGTVASIRSAFQVSQNLYSLNGTTLRANPQAPTIPASLTGKIVAIEGLDQTSLLRQPRHVSVTQGALVAPARAAGAGAGVGTRALAAGAAGDADATASVLPPPIASNLPSPYCSTYFGDSNATLSTAPTPYAKTLPWLGCGYTPQQLQASYGLNPFGFGGQGVTVAILDAYASPTLMADGNMYAARHNLPPLTSANFSEIIPAGIYNVSATEACGPYGWWGEQSLDLAAVHGAAPGAKILYVGSRDCGTSLSTALLDTIYNHRADIITNSYGYNGEADDASDIAAQEQGLMAAAVEGISVLFSSGDDGDLSQNNGVATGSFEATSPYATAIGGTSLLLANKYGKKTEYGWGNYRAYLAGATVNSGTSITTSGVVKTTNYGLTYDAYTFYAGSGGGISLLFGQPDYQVSTVPSDLSTYLNLGNGNQVPLSPMRVTPDISAVADPYTGYLIGETFTIAGDAVNDAGCTPTGATTEYCEIPFGGTSLASPVVAGALANVDQIRRLTGRHDVGFANPWLYSLKVGTTPFSSGVIDVAAPATPTAVLRGYVNNPSRVRVVTINSAPTLITLAPFPLEVCSDPVCEGLNDVFNYTTPGYDDVTGLGVPFVPFLAFQ